MTSTSPTPGSVSAVTHLCWGFDDPAEFADRAAMFLEEGLRLGQQAWFVAPAGAASLAAVAASARGVHVAPLDALWPTESTIDPEREAYGIGERVRAARAAGYTGLRLAADSTTMAAGTRLAAWARFEALVDRSLWSGAPAAALCGYHRPSLGDEALAELSCLHPEVPDGMVPFQLHGTDSAAAAAVCEAIDYSGRALLAFALEHARPDPVGGTLTLDAGGLEFVDHRGLVMLRDYARSRGADLVLRGAEQPALRIVDALALTGIEVEAAP